MQKGRVFVFFDGRLDLVESLFDEDTVLHIQDSVSVTFNLRIVSHHDTGGGSLLAFSLGTHAVDIQDQVHDLNYEQEKKC